MSSNNTTQRPWKLLPVDNSWNGFPGKLIGTDKQEVCFVIDDFLNSSNGIEYLNNAELIVKAVNRDHLFDELVERVEFLQKLLNESGEPRKGEEIDPEYVDQKTKDLLQKAKAEK